jgi:pre-rRNA-processing protein TSR3
MYPETIIVRHKKERIQKCSVQPLTKKSGFKFISFPNERAENLSQPYVRLATDGENLSKEDAESGLLILDCNWRYIPDMEKDYNDVPSRTLPLFQTAYPRVAKDNTDPDQGLATIEAIYIAYCILGRDTDGLFEDYYFGDMFLKQNREKLNALRNL